MPADPKARRFDWATTAGLLLAVGAIAGGLVLEGGDVRDVAQITAAIIVLGGTAGAVLCHTPVDILLRTVRRLPALFVDRQAEPAPVIEEILHYAAKARKNGIVALEQDAAQTSDPFLARALNLAVDGTDLQELRAMLELEIAVREHAAEEEAKVLESAGGYAPTIGIIGAVLGLIQVMKHLSNIDEVGHGIAVAFVATVYGVGLANIVCLPGAGKLRARARQEARLRELILEGTVSIVEGLNPKLIRGKLGVYADSGAAAAPERSGAGVRAQAAS